jgi:RimJ/RimL family protein N-acetyltransferase
LSGAWKLRAITEADARDLATWHYPEPYSLYDSGPEDVEQYLDPANGYFAVVDETGYLVAHCCFGAEARVPGGRYADDAIDIGTGMRPELTGQGRGAAFLRLVIDEARARWPAKPVRTTVAAFNESAQHLVRKAGFREVELFSNPAGREFVVYLLDRSLKAEEGPCGPSSVSVRI